jgi:hypothetical protein
MVAVEMGDFRFSMYGRMSALILKVTFSSSSDLSSSRA